MKINDAVETLGALAHGSRLEIFRHLVVVGPSGAAAGRIAEHVDMHAATLTFHLSALKQAGLIQSRRESRSIIYSANFARMDDLIGYLTSNCCQGAAAAERKRGRAGLAACS
jgi:ArsR family transcriptional regulator, arsenate/arsenite/antimonite-responsive transcriptional repressor